MDERHFFDESRTTREAVLICPKCRDKHTYKLRWLVRRKKSRLPSGAGERDRAKFAKAQSYMLLLDDVVSCSNVRCRARIEVAGIKTTAYLEDPQPGEKLPQASKNQRTPSGNRTETTGNRAEVNGNRAEVNGNRAEVDGNRARPNHGRRNNRRAGNRDRWQDDRFRRRR